MILVYAFALFYALACVVKIYEAIDDRRERARARARKQVTREARNREAKPLPLPPSVSQTGTLTRPNEPAWLISHDEVLPLLSSSLASVQWDGLEAVLSPLTSTERSEVQPQGSLQGLPTK